MQSVTDDGISGVAMDADDAAGIVEPFCASWSGIPPLLLPQISFACAAGATVRTLYFKQLGKWQAFHRCCFLSPAQKNLFFLHYFCLLLKAHWPCQNSVWKGDNFAEVDINGENKHIPLPQVLLHN